jgi:hypothetical protein
MAVRRVVRLDVDAEAMVDEANEDDRTPDRETVASPAGTPELAATQARTEQLIDQQVGACSAKPMWQPRRPSTEVGAGPWPRGTQIAHCRRLTRRGMPARLHCIRAEVSVTSVAMPLSKPTTVLPTCRLTVISLRLPRQQCVAIKNVARTNLKQACKEKPMPANQTEDECPCCPCDGECPPGCPCG